MRKLAPAFILTTIVAFSSGSALALGDMNKSKKAPTATTSADVTAPADARTNGAAVPADVGRAGVSGNAATPPAVTSGMPANDAVALDRSRSSARDCQGIAATDPLYKTHNCGAMKGGPGASGGDGAGASGASGSSSSGSGK